MSEVPVAQTSQTRAPENNGTNFPSTTTQNWAVDASDVRTVKVSNISLKASKVDIKEFFSYTGDILHVEMQRESEATQLAYVTFKDSEGADRAILLSGASIGNLCVTVKPVENYQLPPDAHLLYSEKSPPSAVQKAEDMVSTMLAKGFVLGKDAVKHAKDFDERHQLTSNASARIVSLDRQLGWSVKLGIGKAVVNEKAREVDERFQVSEKTKSALQAAEQKASIAGSAIMRNPYMQAGASWLTSAYTAVAKTAEEVGIMTQEKVDRVEEERNEAIAKERENVIRDFADAQFRLEEEPPIEEEAPSNSDETKPATASMS